MKSLYMREKSRGKVIDPSTAHARLMPRYFAGRGICVEAEALARIQVLESVVGARIANMRRVAEEQV